MKAIRRLGRLLRGLLVALPFISAGALAALPAETSAKPIDRVAEIRRRLLAVEERPRSESTAPDTLYADETQRDDTLLHAQFWPNWPNWPNYWGNWPNWGNWRNW